MPLGTLVRRDEAARIEWAVCPYERAEVIDMKDQYPVVHSHPRWQVSALALVGGFSASACSADYPIGNVEERGLVVDGDVTSATAVVARDDTPGLLPVADVSFQLGDSFDWYMPAVPVGDLDGDGFGDTMLVENALEGHVTTIHLLYGGPRPSGGDLLATGELLPRLVLEGPVIRGTTLQISVAGDVDGDGFVDVLLRTDECEPTQPGEGAYLLYGGPERLVGSTALGSAAVHFAPPPVAALRPDQIGCGSSVSPRLGDLDGDGFADFMLQIMDSLAVQDAAVAGTYLFYGRAERFTPGTPFTSADARLVAPHFAAPAPAKDIDDDGRADLLMGHTDQISLGVHTFLLRGTGERLAGVIDVETRAVPLAALFLSGSVETLGSLDIDADGVSDVLVKGDDGIVYLFYGAPGLVASGVDFSLGVPFSPGVFPIPAGDLDGDGDTDLLSPRHTDRVILDVAVLGGQPQRFTAPISFPDFDTVPARQVFQEPDRFLEHVYPAGDLNGDGASDVFSVSSRHVFDDMPGYQRQDSQLHVHYGRPTPLPAPRLR